MVLLSDIAGVCICLARDHVLPVCLVLQDLACYSNLLAHDELIHTAMLFDGIVQAFGVGELPWHTLCHIAVDIVASLLPPVSA